MKKKKTDNVVDSEAYSNVTLRVYLIIRKNRDVSNVGERGSAKRIMLNECGRTDVTQIPASLLHTFYKRLLTLTHPDTRIVVLRSKD